MRSARATHKPSGASGRFAGDPRRSRVQRGVVKRPPFTASLAAYCIREVADLASFLRPSPLDFRDSSGAQTLRLDPILAIIVPSALALALGRAAAIAVSRRSMRSRQAITASDHGKRSWQAKWQAWETPFQPRKASPRCITSPLVPSVLPVGRRPRGGGSGSVS